MDYRNPDYTSVISQRAERLALLRKQLNMLAMLRQHYRDNPWDFIDHWGVTFDPRNLERGLLAQIPFVLWPKQVEFLQWLYGMWRSGERGLVEKSRDCGVTWLCVGFHIALWLFHDGYAGGFGSRKEDLVDRKGDPDSIFEKVRFFLANIPSEFLPRGFSLREHSAHMRLVNPETGASITGEGGDQIGRGGRKSIYLVDEAAFIEHQELADAALSQNTNCQIDISTPNGNGNPFYKKRMRFNGTRKVFIFDWRDDPRKDDDWYQHQCAEQDPVTVAQEIDRDYNASTEDQFIPAKWVAAAIDAHITLGFKPRGIRVTGFDPADVGDAKAAVNRHGSVILQAREIRHGDITNALSFAFEQADLFRADVLAYDGDGMGAPVMKVALTQMGGFRLEVVPYHGSAGVLDPDQLYGEEIRRRKKKPKRHEIRQMALHQGSLKTNADEFVNYRAQTWTWLRDRFKATYDAIECAREGRLVNADPETLISISSECKCLPELQAELSRPKRLWTANGKKKVESKDAMKRRGVDSPNLADALVIAMSIRKHVKKERPPIHFHEHIFKDAAMGY